MLPRIEGRGFLVVSGAEPVGAALPHVPGGVVQSMAVGRQHCHGHRARVPTGGRAIRKAASPDVAECFEVAAVAPGKALAVEA